MPSNAAWGIEVGAGALKAVKLERSGENIVCTDFAIIPHKRVLSTPDTDEKDARRVALGSLVAHHDLDKAAVAISVPGHSTFARFAKLPPVEPKKIPDIVKFEAVQQIPFPIDEVEWDYQTFTAPDSPDVEVGIFAMTREKVMETLAKWQDVGYTPDCLTLSPLAAYNAVAYDRAFTQQTPGTVLLDIGTTSTDLIVAEGGRMWIRTFPTGGHQFTEALVTAFNLSYTKAEKLKKEAESTQHTRHVLQAMRPVFGDLAQDVQRSIGYYQSLHRDVKLTRVVGLGGTFQLPGLKKFLSQQLQMEVGALDGFSRIPYEGPGGEDKAKEFTSHAALLATAIGCALQGLGETAIGANLMPVKIIREAVWNRKTRWFVAAAAVAVAAGGVAFVRPVIDKAALAGTPRPPEIDAVKRQAKSLKAAWQNEESSAKTDFSASNCQLLLAGRDVYADIAEDFIEQLRMEAEKIADGGAAPPGKYDKVVVHKMETEYSAYPFGPEIDPTKPNAPPKDPGAGEPEVRPRVRARLEVVVALSKLDAQRAIDEVLSRWMDKQNKLDGRPYTIVLDQRTHGYTLIREDTLLPEDKPAGGQRPAGEAPPAAPGPRNPVTRRPGPGRPPSNPEDDPTKMPGYKPPIIWDQREEAKKAAQQGGGGAAGKNIGFGDCDKMAPLGATPAPFPPGATICTFSIIWESVFKQPGDAGGAPPPAPAPPPPPAPAGGKAPAGGGR